MRITLFIASILLIACVSSLNIELNPNEPYTITNPLLWGVKIKCTGTSPDASDIVHGHIIKGSAKINGHDIGADYEEEVHSGDTVLIEAAKSTKAEITNKGKSTIHLSCDLAEQSVDVEEMIKSNSGLSIDLEPNVPFAITNPLLWAVKIKCTGTSTMTEATIHGHIIKGSAKLNGKDIGSDIDEVVHTGESVLLEASKSTKAEITNKGDAVIHLSCDLAQEVDVEEVINSNSALSIDLEPNVPFAITNPLLWSVKIKCTGTSTMTEATIHGHIIKGSAKLNGKDIGSDIDEVVHTGDSVLLEASKSTKAEITNKGDAVIHLSCDLAQEVDVEEVINSNSALSIDLEPNVPFAITNPLLWSVKIKCTGTSTMTEATIHGHIIKGSAKLNGKDIGSDIDEVVHTGDSVLLEASKSTKAEITNKGDAVIHLSCDLAQEAELKSGLAIELKPNVPFTITNPLLWGVKIKCTGTSPDASDIVHGHIIKGSAKINGHDIGADYEEEVHSGETVLIEAAKSTKAEITNKGQSTINLSCDLAEQNLEVDDMITHGADLDIDLEPNKPFTITNPLLWGVKIKCSTSSSDASDMVHGHIIKGSAKINGQEIGSDIDFEVHNGDVVQIDAAKSTKADITNHGTSTIHMSCNLAQELEFGSGLAIDLKPNEPFTITNPLLWGVKIKCTGTSPDASDIVHGHIIKGSAKINGHDIGADYEEEVHSGETVLIEAAKSTKAEITNKGQSTIHLSCDLASESSALKFLN